MAFPTSPSNDDLHTEFGRTFKYSSATNSWSSATPDAPEDNTPTTQGYVDAQSLPLTGVAAGSKAFVQEDNKLFIFTGSGWFEIATINTAPTITSGADASYTLNSDGTPTVITLQATDPEGTPIIWGYQVTSGSLEDTAVTNEGGVFTITPGATEATFNLTFTASDGVNIDTSASSFSLAFGLDWAGATLNHTLTNDGRTGPPWADARNSWFGSSMSVSGINVIIGAPFEVDVNNGSGAAYIFDITTGEFLRRLANPNAYNTPANDGFGISVAIDGNYAIVGAYNEDDAGGTNSGKAYIFDITTGTLLHTLDNPNVYNTSVNDYFGEFVAITGNYAIATAYGEDDAGGTTSGAVYIYDVTTGTLLHTLVNPNAYGTSAGDGFGRPVAASGNYLIVGAYFENNVTGVVYIFDVTTGTLLRTLLNPNVYGTAAGDDFGKTVAASGDYLIVGAGREDDAGGNSSGAAYIFNITDGTLLQTLTNPNPYGTSLNDDFSVSVAIDGNYAVVGASSEDDAGGTESGKVYIFDVTTGELVRTLDNPNAALTSAADYFGSSVSISGEYAIVGARFEDVGGSTSGAAYIFQAG